MRPRRTRPRPRTAAQWPRSWGCAPAAQRTGVRPCTPPYVPPRPSVPVRDPRPYVSGQKDAAFVAGFPQPFVTGVRTCPSAHAHVRAPRSYVLGIVRPLVRSWHRSFVPSPPFVPANVRSGVRTSPPATRTAPYVRPGVRLWHQSPAQRIVRASESSFVRAKDRPPSRSFVRQ